jgi:Holliday junction resolvasome RuvABC endonuclease subunit
MMYSNLFDGFTVIAMDTSTKMTGYSVVRYNAKTNDGELIEAGKIAGGIDVPVYFVALLTLLNELNEKHGCNAVVFEEPFNGRNSKTTIKLARVNSLPILFAGLIGVPVTGLDIASWRKHFHGRYGRTAVGVYTKEEAFAVVCRDIKHFDDFKKSNDITDAIGLGFGFIEHMKENATAVG